MRPLLHLVGQYYDFSFKDWQWFAKRYNMDMDAINPEGLNVAWYHKRMSDHLTSSEQQGASDLQYWVSIRQPVVVTTPAVPVDTAEEKAVPAKDEPEQLLTNDAPAAVIMGAADATEERSEAAEKVDESKAEEKTPGNAEEPAPTEGAAVEEKADQVAVEEKISENSEAPAPVDNAVTEEKASEKEEGM